MNLFARCIRPGRVIGALSLLAVSEATAQPVESPGTASPTAAAGSPPEPLAELQTVAESLWNDYAPESIKADYELVSREQVLALFTRLESAGGEVDLETFARCAPQARVALQAMRALPDLADYADWLREQLDDMEAAAEALKTPPPVAPPSPPPPSQPLPDPPAPTLPPKTVPPPAAKPAVRGIPLYDLWQARIAKRPRPARADEFLPVLRAAFAAEGVPEALVWLAETESTFNPRARSPAGARGLFQLMPATAKSLGLSLLPLDQRTQPQASARAAAAYLKKLHARFGDWPLAIAAYNGGEGRVARTLKARDATDFAGIADHLPAETRLFVPKVLATVRVRAGVTPAELAAPRAR